MIHENGSKKTLRNDTRKRVKKYFLKTEDSPKDTPNDTRKWVTKKTRCNDTQKEKVQIKFLLTMNSNI